MAMPEEERKRRAVAAVAKWRAAHPEEAQQKRREHYLKHREEILSKQKAWRDANPELVKERSKIAQEKYRASPDNTIKKRWLKKKYDLTPEQYAAMNHEQGGLCKICGGPPKGRWDRLHVDHDHVTEKVRGLLCYSCNTILGLSGDRRQVLLAAAAYLDAASPPPVPNATEP